MSANTPPANDPLVERIAQNIVDAVNAIPALHASEGGFYFADYKAGRPHAKETADYVDGRVLVAQGMSEQQEESANTCSLSIQTYFTLRFDATVSAKGDESLDRKANLRAADVLRAVFRDPTRGGLAFNTDLAYAETADESADLLKARVDVVLTVQHQQSRRDPTAF